MLRPWSIQFFLDDSVGKTFHAKLSNQLMKDIQTARLAPGVMMPGSRLLASQLGVNRKTVQLVYEELTAQGWLISKARCGTFVADVLPEKPLSNDDQQLIKAAKESRISSELENSLYMQALVSYDNSSTANDGVPDARLIPYELLSKAYRRALILSSRQKYLGYGDPRGTIELRESVQKMLNMDRFMSVNTDQVCIVRGSQMGIFVASRVLSAANGVIIVEKLCYQPAMAAFESNGFKVVQCDLDSDGLSIDHLEQILANNKVAALYTTPHHQYPTTVSMVMERRLKLLSLSKIHQFHVIEDDYDHEFHYDGRPIPPLASLPDADYVVHIGSMSKVFAPGLRLGYMVANTHFIKQAAQEIVLIDRQGNTVTELAISDLMQSGDVKRHIRKVRKQYQSRRDFTAREFMRVFKDRVSFDIPAGGLALWINISKVANVDKIKKHTKVDLNLNVYHSEETDHSVFIRFGFGALTEAEITASIERLAYV